MNAKTIAALLASALVAPLALAQGSDELWEVKSQMQMAGLPPGMGGSTQQICREKDPKKELERRRDMQGCKITDYKESGNKITVAMTCPQGTGVMEHTYNAARTEYNGTMRMKTKDGDMTLVMSGRKLGSCDAAQARQERDAKAAAMKEKGERMQADAKKSYATAMASMKESQDREIASCKAAVQSMDMQKLGNYRTCGTPMPDYCKAMMTGEHTKPVATACMASRADFCKRYQTMEGFAQAEGNKEAAKMCGVDADAIRPTFCPQAAKSEHLGYLGRFCPTEAKPFAQKHCVGRDFTSAPRDKYTDFCRHYLANNSLEGTPKKPASTTDAVTQGVSKGIDKIKGLFGR